jgi:thiol-disulfide isomerase/thioredoxin
MKIDASILTNDWAINKPSTADQFAFTPPAGSAKVDTAEDIFAPPQHPLVGKVAPAVDVKLLDGGEFKLADHKGKDVVIIDFWATWCGPCVQSLPIINQVAKDYADKGVVFYAMNIREDDATIKPFLAQHKLDMTVALDSDGSVATEYQASGIPQTVIVDRNGVIHAIHVGMSPNLKASLSKDLDSALAVKVKAD